MRENDLNLHGFMHEGIRQFNVQKIFVANDSWIEVFSDVLFFVFYTACQLFDVAL